VAPDPRRVRDVTAEATNKKVDRIVTDPIAFVGRC
jgi:hypothetical protein